jgi:transposase InsO family protein
MILSALREAQEAGAQLGVACAHIELDVRTVQRWRARGGGDDMRHGPKRGPPNKLSPAEREAVLAVATSPEFRDLSPKQIVPKLADSGQYLASESTFYRLLMEQDLLHHRGRARERTLREVTEYEVTRPGQVWSWDITYLRAAERGRFYYLYLFMDVWSRKAVAAEVYEVECGDLAKQLCTAALACENVDPRLLALHQDNGSPMKNANFKALLESMGVKLSYSRPSVSDDNPYSEALFRTAKYCPLYPTKPFASLEQARAWARKFVAWYNGEHLHSGIGFVTPLARHEGASTNQLAQRRAVYRAAHRRHPTRFANGIRAWDEPAAVWLNPTKLTRHLLRQQALAA